MENWKGSDFLVSKVIEKLNAAKGKMLVVVPSVVGASALTPMMAYAAEGDATTAVTSSVGLVTSVSSLFTTYPMNIFLGFGLASAAIGLFVRAKRGSGGK